MNSLNFQDLQQASVEGCRQGHEISSLLGLYKEYQNVFFFFHQTFLHKVRFPSQMMFGKKVFPFMPKTHL